MADTRQPPSLPLGTDRTTVDNPDVRHEHSDVNVRGILLFTGALLITAIVIHIVVWWLFEYYKAREAKADPPLPPLRIEDQRLPPEPRLQTRPIQDNKDFRYSQERQLSSYGWIDQSTGVVHIPIDQAMRVLVEREGAGLKIVPPEAPPGAATGGDIGKDSNSGQPGAPRAPRLTIGGGQ